MCPGVAEACLRILDGGFGLPQVRLRLDYVDFCHGVGLEGLLHGGVLVAVIFRLAARGVERRLCLLHGIGILGAFEAEEHLPFAHIVPLAETAFLKRAAGARHNVHRTAALYHPRETLVEHHGVYRRYGHLNAGVPPRGALLSFLLHAAISSAMPIMPSKYMFFILLNCYIIRKVFIAVASSRRRGPGTGPRGR